MSSSSHEPLTPDDELDRHGDEVLQVIEELDEDDPGAPLTEVVADLGDDLAPTHALGALYALHMTGHVYQPTTGYLRTTRTVTDGGSGR